MACELIQREFSVPDSEEKVLVGVRQLSASAALALHLELVGKVGGAIFPFIQNNYKFGDIIHFMRQAEAGVMTELMKRRADLNDRIESAESAWMEASEALEAIEA